MMVKGALQLMSTAHALPSILVFPNTTDHRKVSSLLHAEESRLRLILTTDPIPRVCSHRRERLLQYDAVRRPTRVLDKFHWQRTASIGEREPPGRELITDQDRTEPLR